jgi:succinate dehydrogenase/fumarate reductase flavoprotein subunit
MTGGFDAEYDLVVLGAGAAGMTAALVAAIQGARVLLLESTPKIGGTSARSSGTVWIPDNPDMRRAGIPGDAAAASTYLDALVGEKADRALRQAFLEAGPAMIAYLEERAGFEFRRYREHPDYHPDLPGAAMGHRALEPPAFDGRLLGNRFDALAWPIRELMLFDGMMVTRGEAQRLLRALASPGAALLGMKLVLRYLADRVRYPRGTRLVLGNALVARLYKGLLDRNVDIWMSTKTERLLRDTRRVVGAVVSREGGRQRVAALMGVVLAGGGFPAGAEMRERYLRWPVSRWTPAYEGCVGETIRLGCEAGGALGLPGEDNALWFPSSVATRKDGSTAVYPHIVLDRAKPGLVAVGASGLRFTDEAASYHEFARGMFRANAASERTIPAWLVCDRRFVWKYGLGMIRPRALSLGSHVASGYLHQGDSVAGLAASIGVNAAGLAETIRRHCEFARSGIDPDFGKGGNAYDRANGDPGHRPNPCLGPIERAPFCAVRVEPTPLGTSLGLRANEHAQVLDSTGEPIRGLYAVGNDMHSVMGGEYPGAGAQLGPGMAFGYLAALHATKTASQRRAA